MTPASTTTTSSPLAESVPVLTERVEDAAQRFPADGLVAGPADTQEVIEELLPADDAFVLVVPAGPAPGQQLVLVVSPALLKALGLSDADGLAGALAPVIAELAGPHEVHEDQIRLGIGPIGLAGVPVSGEGPGASLVAAGLFLGTDHVATLGIGIPAETANEPEPTADVQPAPGVDDAAGMDLPEVEPVRSSQAANGRGAQGSTDGMRSLSLIRNVEMNVTAELGRARMTVADLLSLTPGSVVELDRVAGSPIDLLVNGTLLARGEVVVIDEEFGVRITEIVDRAEEI
jgi:flagellar motor switch protein FliN